MRPILEEAAEFIINIMLYGALAAFVAVLLKNLTII